MGSAPPDNETRSGSRGISCNLLRHVGLRPFTTAGIHGQSLRRVRAGVQDLPPRDLRA
jgi:hypothetical protein